MRVVGWVKGGGGIEIYRHSYLRHLLQFHRTMVLGQHTILDTNSSGAKSCKLVEKYRLLRQDIGKYPNRITSPQFRSVLRHRKISKRIIQKTGGGGGLPIKAFHMDYILRQNEGVDYECTVYITDGRQCRN